MFLFTISAQRFHQIIRPSNQKRSRSNFPDSQGVVTECPQSGCHSLTFQDDEDTIAASRKYLYRHSLFLGKALEIFMSKCSIQVGVLICVGSSLSAQTHNYTRQDVEDGARLYHANCLVCHGAEGNSISGVDLGHGRFRRASSDADLNSIIRNGIQGTAMPPNRFSEFQAGTVVAYLRSMAASTAENTSAGGDAARGKALFEGKGGCTACHRVKGQGSRVGPDLSDIGILRRSAELEESLVDPNAEILPENRYVRVVTRDGTIVIGRHLNEDTFTLQLLDSQETLRMFSKRDLREYTLLKDSPCPPIKISLLLRKWPT